MVLIRKLLFVLWMILEHGMPGGTVEWCPQSYEQRAKGVVLHFFSSGWELVEKMEPSPALMFTGVV